MRYIRGIEVSKKVRHTRLTSSKCINFSFENTSCSISCGNCSMCISCEMQIKFLDSLSPTEVA